MVPVILDSGLNSDLNLDLNLVLDLDLVLDMDKIKVKVSPTSSTNISSKAHGMPIVAKWLLLRSSRRRSGSSGIRIGSAILVAEEDFFPLKPAPSRGPIERVVVRSGEAT